MEVLCIVCYGMVGYELSGDLRNHCFHSICGQLLNIYTLNALGPILQMFSISMILYADWIFSSLFNFYSLKEQVARTCSFTEQQKQFV